MLKSSARSAIRLRGVRHNNLKNFDLDLPLNQLIVITGLSGSGKSSLAFDTLFAEGQRRYIETFSPYARQFFDRMDKPQVDSIEGIPPAIAIAQRNSVKTTRSTVGTMTEICDYMKVVWPFLAQLFCRQCGQPVQKETPQHIWDSLNDVSDKTEWLVTFELPLTEKLSLEESLGLISKQGYQRLLMRGQVKRLDEILLQLKASDRATPSLTVLQDRVKRTSSNRSRFTESCEQAYHFGKGKLTIWENTGDSGARNPRFFSNRLHCAQCDIEYREPSPALFSFNHPLGACPTCRGFGRVINIDYNLALPDRSKTLAEGAVKPWQTGQGAESQRDLLRACRHFEIPTNIPFSKLKQKWQDFVIQGDPDYGKDEAHEWPAAWYGIKGYFRWLESKAYKMHVRVLLSRYRAYTTCTDCGGMRFQPDSLLYRVKVPAEYLKSGPDKAPATSSASATRTIGLAEFYQMPIRDALRFVQGLSTKHEGKPADPLRLALNEVLYRLGYLCEVGLGYLTLDRPTRSLSGGETERVSLTTCLGARLVNTLFVLDEPSVGLHSRDTERLIGVLQRLRDMGNTVVVVEHEANVMRAADQIVDLGPGHGSTGGHLVFQGPYRKIGRSRASLTGQYLSGRKQIEVPERRPVPGKEYYAGRIAGDAESLFLKEAVIPFPSSPNAQDVGFLTVRDASQHNLKQLTVQIPLRRFVCISGVSGSGKTTFVRDVLLPGLSARLNFAAEKTLNADERLTGDADKEDQTKAFTDVSASIEGWESLRGVVLIDQAGLGKTPRSNPAVYIGAFEHIRELFAQSEEARQRGLGASAFSFNSTQGQCQRCRGAGFEKIEMQFLSDIFIRCPECDGRRFRPHILEIKVAPAKAAKQARNGKSEQIFSPLSIADLLNSTVEESIAFLQEFEDLRPARRAVHGLKLLEEVGLGYLKLGQPINTLSGGECQRLKLVRHLAEVTEANGPTDTSEDEDYRVFNRVSETGFSRESRPQKEEPRSLLFLFDEPTTGLHFEDVRILLRVFQRLVDSGHSVMVIEHNLDVLKSADWLIDLGPEAGDLGGELVIAGTPEEVAGCARSFTGQALRPLLEPCQELTT